VHYKSILKKDSLYSIVILLIFTLIVGNLIYNIQYLDMPTETIPFGSGLGGPGAAGEISVNSQYLKWSFVGFVSILILISVVGLIWSMAKGRSLISRWELLGYGLGMAFLCIIVLFLPEILNFLNELLGHSGTSTNGGGNGVTGDVSDVGFGYPIGIVILLIVAVGIVVYYIVSRISTSAYTRFKSKKIEHEKGELLKYVEDAISDLELGGNARTVIIRCYRNMCAFMGKKGFAQKSHYTPREFEFLVMRKTGLKGKNLRGLTALFEEARYSAHELTEYDKNEAVRHLRNFRDELEKAKGDVLNE